MYKVRLDITGEIYGRLKAVEYRGKTASNQAIWAFECLECGCVVERPAYVVRQGNTKSCGCSSGRLKSLGKKKHGISQSSVYGSYRAMLRRCYDPKTPMFHRYGGRGITVCERWLGDFGAANFFSDMGDKPSPQHTLERIDNDLGYGPDNCRWATRKEQADNRCTTRHITVNGETLNQAEWDRTLGNGLNIVGDRVRRGWREEDAVTTAVAQNKQALTYNGRTMSAHAWEIELGLGHGTIAYRMKKLGWSLDKAISTPSRKRQPLTRSAGPLPSEKS
jgi:hypothetical protein